MLPQQASIFLVNTDSLVDDDGTSVVANVAAGLDVVHVISYR